MLISFRQKGKKEINGPCLRQKINSSFLHSKSVANMFSWKSSWMRGTFSLFEKNLRIDRNDLRMVDGFIILFNIRKWRFLIKRLTDCVETGSSEAITDFVCFFWENLLFFFLKELFYWVIYPLRIVIVKCYYFMSSIIRHTEIDNFTKERKHFICIHICKWPLAEKVMDWCTNMMNVRSFQISITLLWW